MLTMWFNDMIDYFFRNIVIDTVGKKLDVYNAADITELLVG